MSKMIQIRNVPDALHRTLKSRAAAAGMSLSNFLLAEVQRSAARPTLDEMRERLRRRQPVSLGVSAARTIRADRDSR
jgi:antitoxin FitA